MPTGGPLSGLRVVDYSIQGAGPYTGSLLGMLGAEVIKIERPQGDGTRFAIPRQRGMGTNYISLNTNKRNAVLDLKTEEGRQAAIDLTATSDVLVENLRVGVMDRLGLGHAAMCALNPRLVYCSLSGFGQTGPLAKAGCGDGVMQAFSGFARANGAPGELVESFRFTGLLDLASASVATRSILAALMERDVTGLGQFVSVSMLEAAFEMLCTRVADLLYADVEPVPRGSESGGWVPDRAWPTLDREVFVTVRSAKEWSGFCEAIGRKELADDALFRTNADRVANRDALQAILGPIFLTRPAIWWLRIFQRYGVPVAIGHNFETFRYHEQIRSNAMLADVTTPEWGTVCVGGAPWHFSETREEVTPPASPDHDTAALLEELKQGRKVATSIQSDETFAKLKVVELAEGIAGPLAGLRFAELGAQVIKLEPPEGDWMRLQMPLRREGDVSAGYYELNRGKVIEQLPVEDAAVGERLAALLRDADVLITDRNAAQLTALGLDGDADAVFAGNPRLVTVCVSPWGRHGPLASHPGSELTAQAMSGYTRYLGTHGEPAIRLGADMASAATGVFAAQAALAAIYWRRRSGRGQRVDVSLLNTLLSLKSVHVAAQTDPDDYDSTRVGAANHPPHRGWRTAANPILVKFGGSVGSEGRAGWVDFVKEIGLDRLLDDPRCDKQGRLSTGRGALASVFRPAYEEAFARYTGRQLCEMIARHGGDSSEYIGLREALAHEQTQVLGILQEIEGEGGSRVTVRRFPTQFAMLEPLLFCEWIKREPQGKAV